MAPATKLQGSNPWFTKGLMAKRKEIFALWDKYIATKTERSLEVYKKKVKAYKKHCDKAKRKFRATYKEKLGDVNDMASYVESLNKKPSPQIGTIQRPDGSYTLPGEETLKALADIHFQGHNTNIVRSLNAKTLTTTDVLNECTDWLTAERLIRAFNDFKSKKSPGKDKLKPIVLKHLPTSFVDLLLLIYKGVICTGYTPEAWCEARVVFIPKPGKTDYTNPKAFRPISLTNYLIKGLEKLVRWKMEEEIALHPLNKNQHGFRKGYSTETAISETVTFIEQRIMNKQYCLGVFLDIQAAFDSIDPKHIKTQLCAHGCPILIADWYYGYLTYRPITIEGKYNSFSTIINKGFPQGGVCSANFWSIAYNEAVEILNGRGVTGKVYADDSCALIGGTDLKYMFHRMGQVLMQLEAWGMKCGLKFNPTKTEAVLFSRDNPNKRSFTVPRLRMSNTIINLSDSVKYLGVTLDRKLLWTDHINNKLTTCKQLMMKLFHDVRGNFGPKPRLIKWAYEGIIRPKLTYACIAWGHKLNTKLLITKLKALDRLAARSMATISRRAPQASIEVMVNMLPVDLHIRQLGINAAIRLKNVLPAPAVNYTNPQGRHGVSHLTYWEQAITKLDINPGAADICDDKLWDKSYKVNLDSLDGHKKHRKPSEYTIFTDGSKTSYGVGSGFVIYHKKEVIIYESIKLPDYATVFQAEVLAVREAAKFIRVHTQAKHIKILTDSQAGLLALASPEVSSILVWETAQELETLALNGVTVRLAWIKAHVGIEGNEMADSAAKLGGEDSMGTNRKEWVPIPPVLIRADVERAIRREWKARWINNDKYKMTKQFLTEPNKRISNAVIKLSKTGLSRLIQLVTGHNFLSYFQFKLDGHINPLCRLCGEENETFFHLISECPALEVERRKVFLDNYPVTDDWRVRELMDFSFVEPIHSWLTDKDHLMEQPIHEIDINYSITDSDDSL
jgi:ribonuclease HI